LIRVRHSDEPGVDGVGVGELLPVEEPLPVEGLLLEDGEEEGFDVDDDDEDGLEVDGALVDEPGTHCEGMSMKRH
jgi:hypothetical protein